MKGLLRWLRRHWFPLDDTVFVDYRLGTTGAWTRRGLFYEKGDTVPHTERGHSTYSVRVHAIGDHREGWWVNVVQGRIQDCSDKPIHSTVIDADGRKERGDASALREPRQC